MFNTILPILFTLIFILGLSCSAGGVLNYIGSNESSNAAITMGSGGRASVNVNLEMKIPLVVATGIFDTNGTNISSFFSGTNSLFPGRSTFTSSESAGILVNDESDLRSKFFLNLQNNDDRLHSKDIHSDLPSQDILIKGAVFTNSPSSNISIATDANVIVLSGGTGKAPQVSLRAVGGVPAGGPSSIATQRQPASGMVLDRAKRTNAGYARYVIVADFKESSIDASTHGEWNGGVTIMVTGL